MTSYWIADDKIPVEQKSVRIPAENGTNFVAGQEIRIRIDPSIKFFNPKDTYIEANVKVVPPTYSASGQDALPTPTRLQLDGETGFSCLCRNIRISDGMGNVLESIENYNTMVAFKYDYDTNDSIKNKRALTEGSTAYNKQQQGNQGGTKSMNQTCVNNPFVQDNAATTDRGSASFTADNFINAKCCVPLHTGIFTNDKVFPNMLLNNGLIITILLEDNNKVFRQLDSTMQYRRLRNNPKFHGKSALGASLPNNASFNKIFLLNDNQQHTNVQQCPFSVGEAIGFQRIVAGANASVVAFDNACAVPVIKNIALNAGYFEVELNASAKIDGFGIAFDQGEGVYMYSKAVENATTYNPTYLISDVNLIVQSVNMPQGAVEKMTRDMSEGGVKEYDFMSATCYKYSQLASDRVSNIRIPINESRSLALFCIPTDGTVYTSKQNINASETYIIKRDDQTITSTDYYLRSNRSGLVGISDNITNYQFQYDGRLQPNRSVALTKVSNSKSIAAQHLIELDKALGKIGIANPSFVSFNRNFVIARALAIGKDMVYDGVNKDFNLQVNYNEALPPSKNKLWMIYNFHIRRLVFRGADVSVEI